MSTMGPLTFHVEISLGHIIVATFVFVAQLLLASIRRLLKNVLDDYRLHAELIDAHSTALDRAGLKPDRAVWPKVTRSRRSPVLGLYVDS